MAAKKKPVAKAKTVTAPAKTTAPAPSGGSTSVISIAKPTVARGNGTTSRVYEDAVKEIVSLSENESHAKKVDQGALSESRGKDVWALHTQLRAIDQVMSRTLELGSTLQTSIATVDQHLHSNTVATTELVENHGSSLANRVDSTKNQLAGKLDASTKSLSEQLDGTKGSVQNWITSTRTTLSENVNKAQTTLTKEVHTVLQTVKDGFSKLAQATAGTEENLKSQTNAFSQATEQLLGALQHQVEKRIAEFRDESTRQVDKRFNQVDVAFAAVRADQEVIKALLTDIIKDRMGRPEPKVRG